MYSKSDFQMKNYNCNTYNTLGTYQQDGKFNPNQLVLNTPLPPSYDTLQHNVNECGTYFSIGSAYPSDCSMQMNAPSGCTPRR
jgi:hypothetical protein